jgi:hypothetical protein
MGFTEHIEITETFSSEAIFSQESDKFPANLWSFTNACWRISFSEVEEEKPVRSWVKFKIKISVSNLGLKGQNWGVGGRRKKKILFFYHFYFQNKYIILF